MSIDTYARYQMGQAINNEQMISGAMSMRLDTRPFIKDFENFLRNKRTILVQDKNGQVSENEVTLGPPLATEVGIAGLSNMLQMRFNQHLAQGNFKTDFSYRDWISSVRENISIAVIDKAPDWGVRDSDVRMIIDNMMDPVEIFATRPIDDKEREHLVPAIQSKENIVQHMSPEPRDKRGFMGLFGGN